VPCTVTYLEDAGVIEMVFPQSFSVDEVYAAVGECTTLAEQHGCRRFLVDTRVTSQEGDSFDILRLAEYLSSMPPGAIEKEAVLPPTAGVPAGDFRFFETAARNRGLNVRIMTSREEALAWLSA
jgi:hypothetical protein